MGSNISSHLLVDNGKTLQIIVTGNVSACHFSLKEFIQFLHKELIIVNTNGTVPISQFFCHSGYTLSCVKDKQHSGHDIHMIDLFFGPYGISLIWKDVDHNYTSFFRNFPVRFFFIFIRHTLLISSTLITNLAYFLVYRSIKLYLHFGNSQKRAQRIHRRLHAVVWKFSSLKIPHVY